MLITTSFIFNTNVFNKKQTVSDTKAYIPLRCKTTGMPPNAEIRVGNANMLVSKNVLCVSPNAKPKICISLESVEHRLRWVSWHWGLGWACTFHVVYFLFPHVGYPTWTQFPVEYRLKSSDSFYQTLSLLSYTSRLLVFYLTPPVPGSATPLQTLAGTSTFHAYRLGSKCKWQMLCDLQYNMALRVFNIPHSTAPHLED